MMENGKPASDVRQLVGQPLGLGLGQLTVEQQRLGPDEQIVGEDDDLQPHLVESELLERELAQAGVLVVADPVSLSPDVDREGPCQQSRNSEQRDQDCNQNNRRSRHAKEPFHP